MIPYKLISLIKLIIYRGNDMQNIEMCLPSDKLASSLISSLTNIEGLKQKFTLVQLLNMIKIKKNPNYEKLANYIEKQLTQKKCELFCLIQAIRYLGQKFKQANNSQHQIKCIMSGFKKYFLKLFQRQAVPPRVKKDFVLNLVRHYFQFETPCCYSVAEVIYIVLRKLNEENKANIEKVLYDSLIQHIRQSKLDEEMCYKYCSAIHCADLYKYFKISDLIHIVMPANIQQTIFFFRDLNGNVIKQLAEAYIVKNSLKQTKKVTKFIQKLSLNALDYPEYIKNLKKSSLRYFLTQEPIYSIDLKIKGRPDIAECLIQILLDQNRDKEALHFINKYYISKYYHLNPSSNRSYNKNLLEKFDQFKPTQYIMAQKIPNSKHGEQSYLQCKQFGFGQTNVIYVDQQNVTQQILDNIYASPRFGIDCQNNPVFNAYEKRVTSTMQIAIDYKIISEEGLDIEIKYAYVFALPEVCQSGVFRKWFAKLKSSYKGEIIGHTVRADFASLIKEISNEQNQQKSFNINHLKFVDIAQLFKSKYKQTKSSLQYICKSLLHKSLSKFQQCSGWHNRPLRLAQLHYAALDSILPLKLYKKLT